MKTNTSVDAVRIKFAGGNISAGEISLVGLS